MSYQFSRIQMINLGIQDLILYKTVKYPSSSHTNNYVFQFFDLKNILISDT